MKCTFTYKPEWKRETYMLIPNLRNFPFEASSTGEPCLLRWGKPGKSIGRNLPAKVHVTSKVKSSP